VLAVSVVVVSVLVTFGTDGVLPWPGTVRVGAVGNGSAEFLLPPPQAARTGARTARAAIVAAARRVMA
jgi:hypothetical protein